MANPLPRLRLSAGTALITGLLSTACVDGDATRSGNGGPPPEPITTATVIWQPQQTTIEAVGTSRARHAVMLYPASTGEVVAVHFTGGQKVKAGQTLLELDSRDERLAVADAALELADAERLLERYRRTRESGAVTESVLDDARSRVERARIALNRAKVALDHRSIQAPFTGHVGLTDIDPGAWIGPDTAVAEINDRSVLLVRFELPEVLLGRLQIDQTIELSTWADSGQKVQGRVEEIDSRVDPRNRTFAVRAHVDNTDDRLRPGMSFRILLTLDGNRYPVVPEVALQWGGDGAYVWRVADGKAQRVSATIVQRRRGEILVDANLPADTIVVMEGIQRMREGQPVRNVTGVPDA